MRKGDLKKKESLRRRNGVLNRWLRVRERNQTFLHFNAKKLKNNYSLLLCVQTTFVAHKLFDTNSSLQKEESFQEHFLIRRNSRF